MELLEVRPSNTLCVTLCPKLSPNEGDSSLLISADLIKRVVSWFVATTLNVFKVKTNFRKG